MELFQQTTSKLLLKLKLNTYYVNDRAPAVRCIVPLDRYLLLQNPFQYMLPKFIVVNSGHTYPWNNSAFHSLQEYIAT